MALVINRKTQEGIQLVTKDGPVQVNISKIKGKQVYLAVKCAPHLHVNRVDWDGNLQAKNVYTVKDEVKPYTFEWAELAGKKLQIMVTETKTHRVVCGYERENDRHYVLHEERLDENAS